MSLKIISIVVSTISLIFSLYVCFNSSEKRLNKKRAKLNAKFDAIEKRMEE